MKKKWIKKVDIEAKNEKNEKKMKKNEKNEKKWKKNEKNEKKWKKVN